MASPSLSAMALLSFIPLASSLVMPAMSDFDNSEALKEAVKFDPDGRRTLGVVTKTDDVRPGCGIRAKLRMKDGRGRPHLGYIAVVNRTPTEQDASAEEIRKKERKFFSTNPELVGLEKRYWGLHTLVERVVEIQKERVEEVSTRRRESVTYYPALKICRKFLKKRMYAGEISRRFLQVQVCGDALSGNCCTVVNVYAWLYFSSVLAVWRCRVSSYD